MGKQGPCCHCGITSTPLWRNGPPEKPVLCNACGSRWRTKGTLAKYTPLHARPEADDFQDDRFFRVKNLSIMNNEVNMLKRRKNLDCSVVGVTSPDYYRGSRKIIDEDTSNRSSSGSAISNNESCAQFGSADANDLTGSAQSVVWDTTVPSRKRTCVNRPKPSPVEKLTKDLYNILREQQSSYLSGSSEEDLLFQSDHPLVSVEIGHGSVLIRHPSSIAPEEEPEASSLSVDNKLYAANEFYSGLIAHPLHNKNKGVNFPSHVIEEIKKPTRIGMEQGQLKRDRILQKNLHIFGNHDSLLCHIDLKGVINFDEFASHLTNEEKQQLLKYLPPIDAIGLPDSLKSMFDSPQFKDNLSSFQKLLMEGVFDLSLANVKTEDCITLKRLALCNLSKSKWVEQYNLLKDVEGENSNNKPAVEGHNALASGHLLNAKRFQEGQYQNMTGKKMIMKSSKRVKAGYEQKEENDESPFGSKSLFALPPNGSSVMLDSFHFADETSDQDLLLDVPSNGLFPQAELLPTAGFSAQTSTNISSVCPNIVHH